MGGGEEEVRREGQSSTRRALELNIQWGESLEGWEKEQTGLCL